MSADDRVTAEVLYLSVARVKRRLNLGQLHPWLSTPEAAEAARRALAIPLALMGAKAAMVGDDELFSEALAILTECALPPGTPRPGAHIGSMWTWPEGERAIWAVREVGYALNGYLRRRP